MDTKAVIKSLEPWIAKQRRTAWSPRAATAPGCAPIAT